MDEEGFDIYGDDLTGGADSKAADNEDDLLYGDLSDAGAAASGKETQTEAQDQDKGEGAGEEDLELNLYEVGDKEDEDDSRSSSGRRGLERERYPAGGDRPQQNKERM
ncbi:uncharacterized protein ACA1_075280 [Acanthamoeba castellanii str. Neff]|uniref:Uncharacterized protein n=1 Tax=Acanthamoeba castellanii (strain ATCC 30010 / Neff) TaxID=1257118 RepID=L8HEJ3_ACACF|nr:uncharacterized protein ACA1_075280 [Acanthamoeba castellanii str. Neff]ELR23949.1 hypothetical protein ACA1_075280 [Acanthamoeba castellanii str. Neff]